MKPTNKPVAASAVPALPARGPSSTSARRAELALAALAVAAIAGWLVLYRWYSLFDHVEVQHFGFDKVPGHFGSPVIQRTELIFLGLAAIYVAGFCIIASARRLTWPLRVATAMLVVGPATVNVLLYPVGALDVFRYAIELKLFYLFHQNPYLHDFMAHRSDPFAQSAFLPRLPLVYGPVWALLSALPGAIVGYVDLIRFLIALKIFNLVLLLLTTVLIVGYRTGERRRWTAAYLFLANPLVLFEGVANAHNDAMVTVFLVAAVVAMTRRRWLAAPLFTCSALVKPFALPLAPLFAAEAIRQRWGLRRIAVSVSLAVAVVVASVAPFWAGGELVHAWSSATAESQNSDNVSISSLIDQYERPVNVLRRRTTIPPAVFGLLAVGLVVSLWSLRRGRSAEGALMDSFLLVAVLLTLLYPWYLISAIAIAALKHDDLDLAYIFVATTLGLAYYPFYIWARFDSGYSTFERHLFLSVFLTVPIVAFFLLRVGRAVQKWATGRRMRGADRCLAEESGSATA